MAKKTPKASIESPGPGCYEDMNQLKENWVKGTIVGRSARFKENTQRSSDRVRTEESPFGYYVEESYEKTRLDTSPTVVFTTEMRSFDKQRKSTPGPGQYSIEHYSDSKQGARVTIGTACRSLDSNLKPFVPCPTNYTPDHNTIKLRHPAFTMTKQKKKL